MHVFELYIDSTVVWSWRSLGKAQLCYFAGTGDRRGSWPPGKKSTAVELLLSCLVLFLTVGLFKTSASWPANSKVFVELDAQIQAGTIAGCSRDATDGLLCHKPAPDEDWRVLGLWFKMLNAHG